jgi:hypothetical protein
VLLFRHNEQQKRRLLQRTYSLLYFAVCAIWCSALCDWAVPQNNLLRTNDELVANALGTLAGTTSPYVCSCAHVRSGLQSSYLTDLARLQDQASLQIFLFRKDGSLYFLVIRY